MIGLRRLRSGVLAAVRLRRPDQPVRAVPSPAGKNDQASGVAAAARAHPLHAVIADALRWGGDLSWGAARSGTPTDHLWATAYGGAPTWHGDPDEVAGLVLAAIAAAPAGPVTREAWARLRAEVAVVPERPSGFTVPGGPA